MQKIERRDNLKFLKDRLSFIDCIGYPIAKKNNATPFLEAADDQSIVASDVAAVAAAEAGDAAGAGAGPGGLRGPEPSGPGGGEPDHQRRQVHSFRRDDHRAA